MANKRVIITAGAAGIGAAIARRFAAEGGRVAVCDADPAAVAAFVGENPAIMARVADVTDEAAAGAFLDEALDDLGGVDVLVNNAGIAGPTGYIEDLDLHGWRRCLSVNLDGLFLFTRRVMPEMKGRGSGAIINIASTAGQFGFPLRTPYAAAKWAVVGLTKTLAMEAGPAGVRVNAISPGSVDGPRMDRVIAAAAEARGVKPEVVRAEFEAQVSMRTFVSWDDIADMALFLASDAASKVSGQIIAVDGNTETLWS